MVAPALPLRHVALLHELGTRLLANRKAQTPLESLARDLLVGFQDICMRTGQDGVLTALGVDEADAASLADDPARTATLVQQLGTLDIDGGGPRNARPRQLAESIVSALGITLADDAERTITLDGSVRAELVEAMTAVAAAELAVPKIRETIIADARARCEERYLGAFEKLVAQLDERGMRIDRQPKIPLDASQAIQRHLTDARAVVLDRLARAAIDRAKDILGRTSPEAAERLDQPVSHQRTPRDVAVMRARDPRVLKTPSAVVEVLLASISDAAQLAWRAAERQATPYSPKTSFTMGELIEHPKFGRGSVTRVDEQRVEVEFADGPHTLVHVGPRR